MSSFRTRRRGAGLLAAAALALLAVAAPGHARADTALTIYGFCAQPNCIDGADPAGTPVLTDANHLFGTTLLGGKNGAGVVYGLSRASAGTPWQMTIIHAFCAKANCADGAQPYAGLILDTTGSGSIYGTTVLGGFNATNANSGHGTVFELHPNKKKSGWKQHVLHHFCTLPNCTDGADPVAAMLMDGQRNLYGTTSGGGALNSKNQQGGTVFELAYIGNDMWAFHVLYNFCATVECPDGAEPQGALVMDGAGNLYGTTYGGGAHERGTVFKLAPNGTETVLYSFCAAANCADGANPAAGLAFDGAGNLVGTTQFGGAGGQGTVFSVTPTGSEKLLYSFCAAANCTDGAQPAASLIRDSNGNLYGTTALGGAQDLGVAFMVPPAGGHETVLYSFCSNYTATACVDGAETLAGLAMDASGTLYGVTQTDGGEVGGTVFSLTP